MGLLLHGFAVLLVCGTAWAGGCGSQPGLLSGVVAAEDDESSLVKAARDSLRSKSAATRAEAYSNLAAAVQRLAVPPSSKVTQLFVKGLEDESLEARGAALVAMGSCTHKGTKAAGLAKALQTAIREVDRRTKAMDELKSPKKSKKKNKTIGDTLKELEGMRDGWASIAEALQAHIAFLEDSGTWVADLIGAAQGLKDDRVTQALLEVAKAKTLEVDAAPLGVALVTAGTRTSVKAALQQLERCEHALRVLPEEEASIKNCRLVRDSLTRLAEGIDLADDKPESAEDWRQWFATNQKQLPTKVGRLKD